MIIRDASGNVKYLIFYLRSPGAPLYKGNDNISFLCLLTAMAGGCIMNMLELDSEWEGYMTNRELLLVIAAAIIGGDTMFIYIRKHFAQLRYNAYRFAATHARTRKFNVQARFFVMGLNDWLDTDFSLYAKNEREAISKANDVVAWYQSRRAAAGISTELRNLFIIPA